MGGRWSEIYDFTPADGNWTFLPLDTKATDLIKPLSDVGASFVSPEVLSLSLFLPPLPPPLLPDALWQSQTVSQCGSAHRRKGGGRGGCWREPARGARGDGGDCGGCGGCVKGWRVWRGCVESRESRESRARALRGGVGERGQEAALHSDSEVVPLTVGLRKDLANSSDKAFLMIMPDKSAPSLAERGRGGGQDGGGVEAPLEAHRQGLFLLSPPPASALPCSRTH
eukprot:490987-Rhodomonas_salina.1